MEIMEVMEVVLRGCVNNTPVSPFNRHSSAAAAAAAAAAAIHQILSPVADTMEAVDVPAKA
jgi:hypothetical protein